MQHVKTVFFLVCCFGLGVVIAKGVQRYLAHRGETFEMPHTGIGNSPKMHGFTVPLDSGTPAMLEKLPSVKLHASAVALVYPTAGSAAKPLVESVRTAHKQGLDAVLLPPPVFAHGDPYPLPLEEIAREAEAAHVDCLCLSWLNADADEPYWIRAATEVRREYHGKLIFAATPEILVGIESFDAVDYLGAIGPVRLAQRLPHAADDVDLTAMRVSWACTIDGLENRALKATKPLMLLNMVVPATISAKLADPDQPPAPPTPNPALQQLAYEALVVETKGRTFTEGLFLPWSNTSADDPEAVNHFPKLVEKVEDLWSPANTVNLPATLPASETEPDSPDTADGGT